MKTSLFATLVTAAAAALLSAALVAPADAAQKRQPSYIYYRSSSTAYWYPRPTRLTVRARSYLDPGTETKAHDEPYTDYAFPPGYLPYDRVDPKVSYNRMPLPDPWDIPGWPKYGP